MTQVQIHGEAADTLSTLSEASELLNDRGEVIGIFTPANKIPRHLYFQELSAEELQRRRQQKTTTTLADIWKKLGVGS